MRIWVCFGSSQGNLLAQHLPIHVAAARSILLAIGRVNKILIDPESPDLEVSLRLEPSAPRAARHHVALVDHPSPDLRDAIVLLTSELVTRAVQQCQASRDEEVQLRVWMPADVVRVEVRAPQNLLPAARDGAPLQYGEMLLDQVADRWSTDDVRDFTLWFEVDRHEPAGETEGKRSDDRSLRSVRWRRSIPRSRSRHLRR